MNFRVIFPLTVIWFMCLLQERSSDTFSPRYLACFCSLKCCAMEFIVKNNRFLFLCDSYYLTFIFKFIYLGLEFFFCFFRETILSLYSIFFTQVIIAFTMFTHFFFMLS